jgi:hypothetical protein
VGLERGIDASEPIGIGARPAGAEEHRRAVRSATLATGTLACPLCDIPVAIGGARLAPADPLGCPFCGHAGAVRDFVTLGEPTRATHVRIRVRRR